MNEKDLVKKVLEGRKEAFEMIVRKYQNSLLNYIGRMVGERQLALDFTQEVFIRSYISIHSYKPQYKFRTWLFKIASNYIIDQWRKKKINSISIDNISKWDDNTSSLEIPDYEPSVVKKFELSELKEKLEQMLVKIPLNLRELFIWRHINGFTYEEIAEIKGLPIGTIKNRVFHAKELIHKLLKDAL